MKFWCLSGEAAIRCCCDAAIARVYEARLTQSLELWMARTKQLTRRGRCLLWLCRLIAFVESCRRGLSCLARAFHLRRSRLPGRPAARFVGSRVALEDEAASDRPLRRLAAVARDAAASPGPKSARSLPPTRAEASGNSQACGPPPSGGPAFRRGVFRGRIPSVRNATRDRPFRNTCRYRVGTRQHSAPQCRYGERQTRRAICRSRRARWQLHDSARPHRLGRIDLEALSMAVAGARSGGPGSRARVAWVEAQLRADSCRAHNCARTAISCSCVRSNGRNRDNAPHAGRTRNDGRVRNDRRVRSDERGGGAYDDARLAPA
jgi:hypothetical protein